MRVERSRKDAAVVRAQSLHDFSDRLLAAGFSRIAGYAAFGDADAATFAERIRARIDGHDFPSVSHVTMSFGVAEIDGADDNMDALHARADQALYAAKRAGRNRVVNWHADDFR